MKPFFAVCFFPFLASALEHLPWIPGCHGTELEIVHPFLPEAPLILEAGAHYGEDTLGFLRIWPDAEVFAFEPYAEYFFQLEKAVSTAPSVHAYPFGLYSETGFYEFHVSAKWDGASSLFESNSEAIDYADEKTTVLCKNLDEWAEEEGVERIDYMWLDMEGAELEMLRAAPRILSRVTAISTEVNFQKFRKGTAQFQEMLDFLESAGFTLFKIWGSPDWQATAVFIRTALLGQDKNLSKHLEVQEIPFHTILSRNLSKGLAAINNFSYLSTEMLVFPRSY